MELSAITKLKNPNIPFTNLLFNYHLFLSPSDGNVSLKTEKTKQKKKPHV